MEQYKDKNAILDLALENERDRSIIATICDALGDETRLEILWHLNNPPFLKTIAQLGKLVPIPKTTLIRHLEKLEKANLVTVLYRSASHGTARVFKRDIQGVNMDLYFNKKPKKTTTVSNIQSIGVGQFADFEGEQFGFSTKSDYYHFTNEDCFTSKRFDAQIVYTTYGRITYYFSNITAKYNEITELSLSLEICSEAPYFDNDYKSDITFWINGIELTTFTSLGDFGDHRGKLNPVWWPDTNTQYGKLVTVTVNRDGVGINGNRVPSRVTLSDLNIDKGNKIIVTLGNKDTALYRGGFNIFGSDFGDYPQDICLSLSYDTVKNS